MPQNRTPCLSTARKVKTQLFQTGLCLHISNIYSITNNMHVASPVKGHEF